MLDITVERLRMIPINPAAEPWEIGFLRVPFDQLPKRIPTEMLPVHAACVTPSGPAALSEVVFPQGMPNSTLIDAFARCALGEFDAGIPSPGYLPGVIRMLRPENEAAEHFVAGMESLGIRVEIKQQLPLLEEFDAFLAEEDGVGDDALSDGLISPFASGRVRALIEDKQMKVARIRAFAAAAAEYMQQAPWDRYDSATLWRIGPKPRWSGLQFAMALGAEGETYGLAFMPSVAAMKRMLGSSDPAEYFLQAKHTSWSVLFDHEGGVPELDVSLWQQEGLPLAHDEAYPIPIGITPSGQSKRPTPAQLTFFEGILRAASHADHEQLRTLNGEAEVEVSTFDGPARFTLKTAMVLEG